MSDDAPTGPRYSWVVRDGDDEPWTLLGYRWTDRESALEEASHWLHCSRHRYAQVKTVEVVGDGWTEVAAPGARVPRRGAGVAGGVSHLVPHERIRPEYTPGTPLSPTTFLPMAAEEQRPPQGLSREAADLLRRALENGR